MTDRLSKAEIKKDTLQHAVEAGVDTVAAVGTIVTRAVRDVAQVLGGFATEVFEIREASRRAGEEHGPDAAERNILA
jgi:hypothetical protein